MNLNNLFQETLNKLKSELDYQPLLEEACKRVVLKYNPYPSQCNLDYIYDNQHRVAKINVKIQYTKPYVIYLGD